MAWLIWPAMCGNGVIRFISRILIKGMMAAKTSRRQAARVLRGGAFYGLSVRRALCVSLRRITLLIATAMSACGWWCPPAFESLISVTLISEGYAKNFGGLYAPEICAWENLGARLLGVRAKANAART